MTEDEIKDIAYGLALSDGRHIDLEPLADLTYVQMVEIVLEAAEDLKARRNR